MAPQNRSEPDLRALGAAYGLEATGPCTRVVDRVWRLATTKGDVAIKCHGPGHASRARKEAGLLAHLAQYPRAGFRTQQLLHTTAGEVVHATEAGTSMLTRWQPGASKTYDRFTPSEWQALGTSLGALHRALDDTAPLDDTLCSRLQKLDAEAMRGDLIAAHDDPSLRNYAAHCLRLIDQYHPGSLASYPADDMGRPIHNDYNQFNYLFDGGTLPVILDWEAAIGAPREYELVRCLNHLPLEAPAKARVFVMAYLRERALAATHLAWAVDAATVQHAFKRWLIDGWRRDPAAFAERLRGGLRMNALFDGARGQLIDFYLRCLEDAHDPRDP